MPKIKHAPTAEQLYSQRGNIAKDVLRTALAEARELASWAGRRVPNGPAAGALMHGYHVGYDDLDLAISMIVARVRSEAVNAFIARTSTFHELRIKPGVLVAGSLMRDNEYATPKMARESKLERNRRQLLVRRTGKCDACGAEFVSDKPGMQAGPAKRTRKQWRDAIKSVRDAPKRKRKATRLSGHEASILFPGDHDLSGFGSEQPWDAGSRAAAKVRPTPAQKRARKARGTSRVPLMDALQPEAAAFGRDWSGPDQSVRVRPRKEKIPNHNESPTGALRGTPKGRSRK